MSGMSPSPRRPVYAPCAENPTSRWGRVKYGELRPPDWMCGNRRFRAGDAHATLAENIRLEDAGRAWAKVSAGKPKAAKPEAVPRASSRSRRSRSYLRPVTRPQMWRTRVKRTATDWKYVSPGYLRGQTM